MGEPWETILRWAIILGVAAFLWSVASSMEQIARALTRLADAEDQKRGAGPAGDPPARAPEPTAAAERGR